MMTINEKKQILELNDILAAEVIISLNDTEHEKSTDLKAFCNNLIRLVPKIQIKKYEGEPDEIPFIGIGNNIKFQALPTGTELGPFVEACSLSESQARNRSDRMINKLNKLEMPAILDIYVAPQCNFCPTVVRQLLPLAHANHRIHLTIKDCALFPEFIPQANIQSVPTIVLENQFRWTGAIQMDELIDIILDRDPSVLGATSLAMILKDGKASDLAEMMLEKNMIFPAFYDLLTDDKWPVRLGAMVVMETLISMNVDLAARVKTSLWERFHRVSEQTQGDILYIFGELGQNNMEPKLKSIVNGQYSQEVKEAAREALDKLKNGQSNKKGEIENEKGLVD
jgi:hypothetical protein